MINASRLRTIAWSLSLILLCNMSEAYRVAFRALVFKAAGSAYNPAVRRASLPSIGMPRCHAVEHTLAASLVRRYSVGNTPKSRVRPMYGMSEHGGIRKGRFYTKHALERMAPNTELVAKELQRRALEKGLIPGTKVYNDYIQPRNISPSCIEEGIKYGRLVETRINHKGIAYTYAYKGLHIVLGSYGEVITVYRDKSIVISPIDFRSKGILR